MKRVDYKELAKGAACNWLTFSDFHWEIDQDVYKDWTVVYNTNRDDTLIGESNAEVMTKEMQQYINDGTAEPVTHRHWGCGWMGGYLIKVHDKDGEPTKAFKAWCDMMTQLEEYPLLDELDYSQREFDQTLQNIEDQLSNLSDFEIPENGAEDVYRYLWGTDPSSLESDDDCGGYPSLEVIERAANALGWKQTTSGCLNVGEHVKVTPEFGPDLSGIIKEFTDDGVMVQLTTRNYQTDHVRQEKIEGKACELNGWLMCLDPDYVTPIKDDPNQLCFTMSHPTP